MLEIMIGDVMDKLAEIPDGTVQTVVTSPPYWGLRDYGTAQWQGGDEDCEHKNGPLASPKSTLQGYTGDHVKLATGGMPFRDLCGKCGATRIDSQIGLEKTPDEYVAKMVAVFREVRRVLRDDGTCWMNLGDSYNANQCFGCNPSQRGWTLTGAAPKSASWHLRDHIGGSDQSSVGFYFR